MKIIMEKKLGKGVFAVMIIIALAVIGAAYASFLIINNEVTYEDGEPLPLVIRVLICTLLGIVSFGYVISCIRFLNHIVKHGKTAFKISEQGIHDTVILLNVLAFVFVVPVKFIPWSEITYAEKIGEMVYIRAKVKKIKTSLLGKIIIGILGYDFCRSSVSGRFTNQEAELILSYCPESARMLGE